MNLDPTDPKLTAYVLDELDQTERAAMEALLRDDEAASREIVEIRRTTELLVTELDKEATPGLSVAQKEAVYTHGPAAMAASFQWKRFWFATGLSAAAAVVLAIGLLSSSIRYASRSSRESRAAAVAKARELAAQSAGNVVQFRQADGVGPQAPVSSAQPESEPFATYQEFQYTGPTLGSGGGSPGGAPVGIPPAPPPVDNNSVGQSVDVSGASPIVMSPPGRTTTGHSLAPTMGDTKFGTGGVGVGRSVAARRIPAHPSGGSSENFGGWGGDVVQSERSVEWEQAPQMPAPGFGQQITPGTESYERVWESGFLSVGQHPLSTFSIDVDTASYANIRRFLSQGSLPPRDAVRIEEMINYFSYDYAPPRGREPFALNVEVAECPWNAGHQLALIGIKSKELGWRKRQPLNLVFLIDVSGSMQPENKLPLIKHALRLLVDQLTERDRVAIVVYASNSRVALSSTRGDDKDTILSAIQRLEAGGSTNGGAGIQSAYREAANNFIEGGVNRVILCTDGDFNVGITDQSDLTRLIQKKAKSSVFLSVLGFGMGNLKDSTMEKLADKGDGNYAYIDDLEEARKVLVDQMKSTLVTVAKDVKIQIEFNPTATQAYRLIGYENRALRPQDFNDDRKDAGEVGAGHAVTALYEIVPTGSRPVAPGVDPLKYQTRLPQGELCTVKLRYKELDADASKLLTAAVKDTGTRWNRTSTDFRFAAAVAEFGMLLRDSEYKGDATFDSVLELAQNARGYDENGYRAEFIELARKAKTLGDP